MEHRINRSQIFILLGTIAILGSFTFESARAMEDEQLEESLRLHAPKSVEQSWFYCLQSVEELKPSKEWKDWKKYNLGKVYGRLQDKWILPPEWRNKDILSSEQAPPSSWFWGSSHLDQLVEFSSAKGEVMYRRDAYIIMKYENKVLTDRKLELYDLERPKLDYEKATYDGMTWDGRNTLAMPELEYIIKLWELADEGAKLLRQNGVPQHTIAKINEKRAHEKINEQNVREKIIRREKIKKELDEIDRRHNNLSEEERIAAGLSIVRRNAARGDVLAQINLGFNYRVGACGVEKDFTQAAYWFLQAAEQGDVRGQANLGSIYNIGGFGVEKNDILAEYWYQKAAAQGDATAIKFLSQKK